MKNLKLIILISFFLLNKNNIMAQKSVEIISLPSAWQMHETTSDKWIPAVVPGCVHSDLLRNKLIPEPYYRTNEKELQ